MPAAHRKGDIGSGHGCHFPPSSATGGSPNVFVNGIPVMRGVKMVSIETWKRGLAGEEELDEDQFYDFIPREKYKAFFQEAFSTLPSGQKFIEKLEELFEENDDTGLYILPKKENYQDFRWIQDKAYLFLDEIRRYFSELNMTSLLDDVDIANIVTVEGQGEFVEYLKKAPAGSSAVNDEIKYQFGLGLVRHERFAYALEEACIFLTKNPLVNHYLLEDVFDFPLPHRGYYELWKAGGDVQFLNEVTLIQVSSK